MYKLKKGDIIIALEDIIIPDTGRTYYIYKNKRYELKRFFNDNWHIEGLDNIIVNRSERRKGKYDNECGWFSEETLFKKFDCVKIMRKKKLKQINENR